MNISLVPFSLLLYRKCCYEDHWCFLKWYHYFLSEEPWGWVSRKTVPWSIHLMIPLLMFSRIFHSFFSIRQRPRGRLGLKWNSKHAQPSPRALPTSKLLASLQKTRPLLTISHQCLATRGTGRKWGRNVLGLLASAFPLGWPNLMRALADTAFRLIFGTENKGRQTEYSV